MKKKTIIARLLVITMDKPLHLGTIKPNLFMTKAYVMVMITIIATAMLVKSEISMY